MTRAVPHRRIEPAGARESGQAFDPVVVSRVLAVAGRAPSLHNTQPRAWRLERDRLDLRADWERQLPVADPDGHSLRISCGAALALTELAFAGHGWLMHVERLPDPDQPDLLASLTAPRPYLPTTADRDQLAAAARRYSERRPFRLRPILADVVEELRAAADGHGVHAHFPVLELERLNLAVAVSWADRVERQDPAYLAEMRRWAQDADVHTQGIPASAVPHVAAGHPRHTDIPLRDFEVGVSGMQQIEADVGEYPLIAVLLTESETPREQLAAGEAMMRLMLRADIAGLAGCPLSQAVDLLAFRARIQTLMDWSGCPQMMLRLGYPPRDRPPLRRSLRRPISDQLIVRQ
jgi:nitroreductase